MFDIGLASPTILPGSHILTLSSYNQRRSNCGVSVCSSHFCQGPQANISTICGPATGPAAAMHGGVKRPSLHLAPWHQPSLALLYPTSGVAPGHAGQPGSPRSHDRVGMRAAGSRGPSGDLFGLRHQTHTASQVTYHLRDGGLLGSSYPFCVRGRSHVQSPDRPTISRKHEPSQDRSPL